MKILHVLPSLNPKSGGVPEAVIQLSQHMIKFGCSSEIVCLDDKEENKNVARVAGKVHFLGPSRGFYGFNLSLIGWVRVNSVRFDAVVVHGIWQFHSIATCLGLIGKSQPLYVFPHGMLDPWFQKQYPLKHFKKLLYWYLVEQFVFRNAKKILFTCKDEMVLARLPFLKRANNLQVNGFGIAGAEYEDVDTKSIFFKQYPNLIGKHIFLFLGRIHEKKGCDYLIEAFAKIAQVNNAYVLVMVGPGDNALISSLKVKANQLGVTDSVHWLGMLSGEVKWGALKAAEVFVLPSHQENFGIAVAEALASGTPVIISDKVNIWHEVKAAGAGLICTDNQTSVTEVLRSWVWDTSQEQKDDIKKQAQVCFNKYFRIDKAAEHLVNTIAAEGEPL